MKGIIPSWQEIGRETIIIIAGALVAALILSRLPSVKAFIQANTAGGCDCDRR